MTAQQEKFKKGKAAIEEAKIQSSTSDTSPEKKSHIDRPLSILISPPRSLHGSVLSIKNELLQHEVDLLTAGTPVVKLDPKRVRHSKWANRQPDSFKSKSFDALVEEIDSSGGNVQPIKVRAVSNDPHHDYEIVYGHRRHQACIRCQLQVNAQIIEIGDKELVIEMERENRNREDLRPYEQGRSYKNYLDEGLFPSQRSLADSLGVFVSNLNTAIRIASLPEDVLNAFPSRLDIQYGWLIPIERALSDYPEEVISIAQSLTKDREAGQIIGAKATLSKITKSDGNQSPVKITDSFGDRKVKLAIKGGLLKLEIDAKNDSKETLEEIKILLSDYFKKKESTGV